MLDTAEDHSDSEPLDHRPPLWVLWSAAMTPVALIVGWIVGAAIQPPGYDPLQDTISVLAGYGADHRWLMTIGLYLVGFGYLITAAGLRMIHRWARALLALGGVAGIGIAAFPEPPTGSTSGHITFAVIGAVSLTAWMFALALGRPASALVTPQAGRGAFPWERVLSMQGCVAAGTIIALSLLVMYVSAQLDDFLGLTERICTALQSLMPLIVVVGLRHITPRPAPEPPHHAGATP